MLVLPLLALPALAAPAQAANSAPCWKLVLQDSYSGHFDTIYPHHCYRDAMNRIPTQLLIYSNTRDEIQAAANAAANGKTYKSAAATGTGTSASAPTSSGSHGVPTAIVVLGIIAVLLLLVGGAGEIWRRTRRG